MSKLSRTHQIIITLGAGVFSLCAGTLLSSSHKDFGKSLTLATLLTLPTVTGSYVLLECKASRRIREAQSQVGEAQDQASEALAKASQFEQQTSNSLASIASMQSNLADIERQNSQLRDELATLAQTLEFTSADRSRLSGVIATLELAIAQLETDLKTSSDNIECLEDEIEVRDAEIQAWETEFSNRVESEADRRFKLARAKEIQAIFNEHDAITSESMALFRRLQTWAQKIASGHESKREIIQTLAASYNNNLDQLSESVETERGHYLEQIELLNMRVGRLQHQLAGDLIEPEYLDCGFSPDGKIANALANWLWVHRQIPLKVTGFEAGADGTVTVGYSYSRSMAPEALVKVIEEDSTQIARNLGLYALEKPQKLQITDCLAVKVRRERPVRKADKGSLYRSKEEFVKYILSQPVRLRIVGEPGSGKTPTVAVLVAHILSRGFLSANTPNGQKLPYCVVESCNPLANISVKNGDELDFCLCWNDGKKGFKGLAQEYRFRKNPANAEYKNQVGYIWIADEVDNTMAELTKDEAKPFKDSLKDGGHVNLGVIVMGQSAMVSTSKGLSIDDQKMMTNIYIDPVSIRTFLTQYGERFYSKRAVEKALFTLEELELEVEEQNEIICDTAREFRIAMVTANRSPVFYQLPYFDSTEIDVDSYQEILKQVALIRANRQQSVATADKPEILSDKEIAGSGAGASATPTQVSCPKCAGTIKRNGKTSTGVQKYLCKNASCKHGFTN